MADYDLDDERDDGAGDDSDVTVALARFKLAADNPDEQAQRKREQEYLKFVDEPGGQWPADIRKARESGEIDGYAIAARPCLEIDKVSPAIDQVVNQAKNAHLAVTFKPKGKKANQKTAEMLKGLYRNIEVESRAHAARMWALERAAKCGRGYYRILKKFANDGDFDLDLVISRILNQFSVYLDPAHQEPDASDAEWGFITEDMPWTKYKRLHPKSKLAKADEAALEGLGDTAPGWVTGEGEGRIIRVAEYFCRRYEQDELQARSDGAIGLKSELGPLPPGVTVLKQRDVEVPKIKWEKINAIEVIEKEDWEGRWIPIIQVLGKEHNLNGKRSYTGIVAKSMDAQRAKNYMASTKVESIGLVPKSPWLIAEGVIEGYEEIWKKAAVRNFTHLPFRLKNFGGQLSPPPQRNIAEPPIQAIMQAERDSDADIQATTKTHDPSLGKGQSGSQSGKAITALQQQSEHGNSNYLEDLAQISMTHEARIVVDLMPYVYDRPGRIAQILGEDDKPSPVMLNQPFTKGPDGQPVPAPAGGEGVEEYVLTPDAEYTAVVSVGKSFSTQREEANAMMGQLAEAAPQMVPYYADLWVRSMDFPGKDDIADRLQKMLPPQLQEGPDGQPAGGDPQAQAQIQQLQQQLQAMQAELQQAKSGIAQAQIKAESAEKIEGARLANKTEIEQMKASIKRLELALKAQIAQAEMQADAARDAREAEEHRVDLQHDAVMTDSSHAQQRELAAMKPSPNAGA